MADLRFAARGLAGSPGFTLVAATLLAVGIGANAVIFGALDAILFRPLPARHPEQLVRMVEEIPRVGRRSNFAYSFYRTLREHSTTLSAVFGEEDMQVAMASPAPAEEVRVHLVTAEYFEVLNASAMVGRTLTAADAVDTPGAPPAVLSYGFWKRRFNGDRRPYPALNLATDGTLLAAIGNDYVFEEVFARQVWAYGKPGDVLVVYSTTGRSPNILRALDEAKLRGLQSIAFLGKDGGPAAGRATVDLIVRTEVTARIQEAQKFLAHCICELVDPALKAAQ